MGLTDRVRDTNHNGRGNRSVDSTGKRPRTKETWVSDVYRGTTICRETGWGMTPREVPPL